MPGVPRRVAITGASGMIGMALTRALDARRVSVVRIGRGSDSDVRWDIARGVLDAASLEGLDAIVNLAGANIAQRWTAAHRRDILESRTRGTSLLCRTLSSLRLPPRVLLSGSAIGAYGSRDDELLTEESAPGSGFLADVVRAWEGATAPAADAGIGVTHLRTGIVLSRRGGALATMLLPFRLGVGGRLGNGSQWMSWIGMHDYVRAVMFLLTAELSGPVNLVSPNPVTNADFTRVLGSVLHRPAVFPVPRFALRTAFGAMADETALASQRVMPARLLSAGFVFDDASLTASLTRQIRDTAA